MPRRRLAAAGIVAVMAVVSTHPAQGQSGSHYVCYTSKGLPKSRIGVLYVTPVLPLTGTSGDLMAAWEKHAVSLDPNAGGRGIAECFIGTESNVSTSREAKIAVWRGSTISDVDWKYATSMTALPSKPGAVYSFCSSGTFVNDKTVYETGVFEIPREDAMSTNSPVEVTFANYLIKEKHVGKPLSEWWTKSVGCPHSFVTREEAQQRHDKAVADLRSSGKSVVAIDWVYARNADTPKANPRSSSSH